MIYFIVLMPILLLTLWWIERRAIVQPVFYRNSEAIKALAPNYKEFDLATVDGKGLEGGIYTPKNYKDTILYFGGQAQDSVGLIPKLVEQFTDYQIITFNYREYGKSSGILTEQRVRDDAIFIYEWVKEFYGDVIVLGYSLGTHPATYVASQYNIKLLYLIAPFCSIEKLIQEKTYLPSKLVFFKFNSEELMKKVQSPVIIVSSKDDTIVKVKHSLKLSKVAKNLRLYKELIGYNHHDLILKDEVPKILNRYRG